MYQDEKAWTLKENGLTPGYSLYRMPRFGEGRMDPRLQPTCGPDVMYETDTGPKSSLARTVAVKPKGKLWGTRERFQKPVLPTDLGPGEYFEDPTLLASPVVAGVMSLAGVDKSSVPWVRRPNPSSAHSFAGSLAVGMAGPEGAKARTGRDELMEVVMQHARRRKHLVQRRTHPKKKDAFVEPIVPDSEALTRQWTQRTTALTGLSITTKGTSFSKSLRFGSSPETLPVDIGPGKYEVAPGFRTRTVYAPNPLDAFPTKRPGSKGPPSGPE